MAKIRVSADTIVVEHDDEGLNQSRFKYSRLTHTNNEHNVLNKGNHEMKSLTKSIY